MTRNKAGIKRGACRMKLLTINNSAGDGLHPLGGGEPSGGATNHVVPMPKAPQERHWAHLVVLKVNHLLPGLLRLPPW